MVNFFAASLETRNELNMRAVSWLLTAYQTRAALSLPDRWCLLDFEDGFCPQYLAGCGHVVRRSRAVLSERPALAPMLSFKLCFARPQVMRESDPYGPYP